MSRRRLSDTTLVAAHQDEGGAADEEDALWAEYDGKVDVTADPRNLDLPLSPEGLLAAVSDPSVGLTASPEQLRAGDALEAWRA